jgi:MGT family glycosyltransferase
MATAYFFNKGDYGHVFPTLGLVSELVQRGEKVIYYTTKDFQAIVEKAGAVFRAYPIPEPEEETTTPAHMATHFLRYSALLLPELIAVSEEEKPYYILFDMFRIWGLHLARYLNIPAICFSPSFVTNHAVIQAIAPDMWGLLTNTHSMDGLIDYREQYTQIAASLQDNYNIATPDMFDTFPVMGDITLVSTIPGLHPAREVLDPSIQFVGTDISVRSQPHDFPVNQVQKPVIFISLGTVFNERVEFYQICLAAFAKTEY